MLDVLDAIGIEVLKSGAQVFQHTHAEVGSMMFHNVGVGVGSRMFWSAVHQVGIPRGQHRHPSARCP